MLKNTMFNTEWSHNSVLYREVVSSRKNKSLCGAEAEVTLVINVERLNTVAMLFRSEVFLNCLNWT